MGLILAKTFEGHHIKIPTDDDPKIKLDCMFFTSTCENMMLNPDNTLTSMPKYI